MNEREEIWEENSILFDKERERWMGANAKLIPSKKETDKLMTKKEEIPWDADEQEPKVSQDWEPRPKITSDLKLKGVDIDFETADNIVRACMFDQYYTLKKEIEVIKSKKDLTEWQKEDLEYNEKLMDATIIMLKHYAVYHMWPEELKEDENIN
jgi:hypothetical protein